MKQVDFDVVFVTCGLCNKLPQIQGLKAQKFILLLSKGTAVI